MESVLTAIEEEINETEWLSVAARNPAFAYLHDSSEDIDTLADGKPFYQCLRHLFGLQ